MRSGHPAMDIATGLGLLGGVVVGTELNALVAAAHLANAILIFGLLVSAMILYRHHAY